MNQGGGAIMGTSCSVQREKVSQRGGGVANANNSSSASLDESKSSESIMSSSLRYAVASELSDYDIAQLYNHNNNCSVFAPTQNSNDNHRPSGVVKNVDDGTYSPKSLAELATLAVCKSLVTNNNGVTTNKDALPPGLPPDVVQDILDSLFHHYALNSTTLLAVLSNNSDVIQQLKLSRCRNVSDAWFQPCSSSSSNSIGDSPSFDTAMDLSQQSSGDNDNSNNYYDSCNNDTTIFDVEMKESYACQDELMSSDEDSSIFASNVDTPVSSPTLAAKAVVTTATTDANVVDSSAIARSKCYNLSDIVMTPAASLPSLSSSTSFSSYSPFQLGSCLTTLDLRGCQDVSDYGLLQLGDLTSLEQAYFDHCHSLCGAGLRVLSHSQQLRTLSLASCRRLTDDGLYYLQNLTSNNLRTLSLDGCRCITDNGMWAIKDLVALEDLNLSCCELITNQGVEYMYKLQNLQKVSFSWCKRITDSGLTTFASQPGRTKNLKRLDLVKSSLTNRGVIEMMPLLQGLNVLDLSNSSPRLSSECLFKAVKQLPELRTLELLYCPGVFKLPCHSAIKNLLVLNLAFTGTKDAQLMSLSTLPNLESLNLESCTVTDRSMQHFADNDITPNLQHLDLADTDVGDTGMTYIAKMQNLVSLSLFYCQVTNESMKSVALLPKLEKLNMDSRDISDEGLRLLRTCRNLKYLDIFSGRISDAGCRHLAKLKNLEHLELCGGGIGDLGCTHLMRLKKLQTLNLAQNERITNRGAASLSKINSLKNLNLSFTGAKGRVYEYFYGMSNLESLALNGCVGVQVLTASMPNAVPSLRYLRLHNVDKDVGRMTNKQVTFDCNSSFLANQSSSVLSAMMSTTSGSEASSNKQGLMSSRDDEDGINDEDEYLDYD